MKKLSFVILIILLVFTGKVDLFAQKSLEKADKSFKNKDYFTAIKLYKEILDNSKDTKPLPKLEGKNNKNLKKAR